MSIRDKDPVGSAGAVAACSGYARSKRSQFQIIARILEIAMGRGATKTALVYNANLNFSLILKYIRLLERKGMLERVQISPVSIYRTTAQGAEALRAITRATSLVFEEHAE